MAIVVQSPIRLIAEGLVLLLEQQGVRAATDLQKDSHLIVSDLIGVQEPYPNPPSLPTVALIENDSIKAQALLAQGYVACVDATQSSKILMQTVNKALRDYALTASA